MFTKGQEVTYITEWNRDYVFAVRTATVHSCGKKRMVLTDAVSGTEFGRQFNPNGRDSYIPGNTGQAWVPAEGIPLKGTVAMAEEEALVEALAWAQAAQAAELARLEWVIANHPDMAKDAAEKLAKEKAKVPSAIVFPAHHRR